MIRHMLARKHATIAVANDDWFVESFLGEETRRQFIVFDSFRYGLIGASHGFVAIVGADRVVAAAIERQKGIAQAGDMGREKPGGANVKIHLVTVAIHRRALDHSMGGVVGSIERMSRSRNTDQV